MNSPIRNVLTLAKREFSGYFATPVAYVFLVIFLLMAGFFTFMLGDLFGRNQASLNSFFEWHPWLYLFLVPAVAMRLWSEEKRTGTLELLLTLPITAWQAVLAKFLASWAFLVLALALTFPVWITVNKLGSPDNGAILCAYVGSALMAGAYLAIGCMTSALTRNQVVSFILSVVICLFTILAGFAPVTNFMDGLFPNSPGVVSFFTNLSVITHFEYFQRGVLDFRDLLFFTSVIVFALYVTGVIVRSAQESRTTRNFSFALGFVIAGAFILIGANAVTAQLRWKTDLTEGKIYTLSEGSERILLRLSDDRGTEANAFKLEVRLYLTRDKRVPNPLSRYAKRVEDMLKEYAGVAGKMTKSGDTPLALQIINVQPDSPEEDQAIKDNIEKFPVGPEEFAYLGLSLSYADRTEKIALLITGQGRMSLRSEVTLEYEISRAITRLLKAEGDRVVVGVMAPPSVQVMGGLPPGIPPQMAMQRGMQPSPPWTLIRELQREYEEIRTVDFASGISRNANSEEQSLAESGIDMLLVIHPQNISERAQFAIDQYVLNGGKLVAFLDPFYGFSQGSMGGMGPSESSSTLETLLPAWGLHFDNQHVLADMDNPFRRDQRGSEIWPTWVNLPGKNHNQEEVTTQDLGTVSVLHAGAFTGNAADKGLRQSNLLNSSTNSMWLPTKTSAGTATNATPVFSGRGLNPAFSDAQGKIARTFVGSGKPGVLAVKLTGNFKTAFPAGDPEALPPADANETQVPDNSLKITREGSQPVVVLVGDVDLLSDQMPANRPTMDLQTGSLLSFSQSNIPFIMNLADFLTGDDDLIRVRSKTQRDRPLELLDRMIEKKTRDTQVELEKLNGDTKRAAEEYDKAEKEYEESQRKMLMTAQLVGNQISVNKDELLKAQVAHAELQKKIERAEQVSKLASTAVRKKKRELREEINALKFRIKWANILIMPALVALFGILIAVNRFKRTAA